MAAAGLPCRYAPAPTGNTALVDQLLTDNSCIAPMRFALRALAETGTPTFTYRFDYNASFNGSCALSDPPEYGVTHGAELSFVFGQQRMRVERLTGSLWCRRRWWSRQW